MIPPVEVNTQNKCDASVIWLHGLGADGHDFEPVAHALNLPSVRFIMPNAPYRAVTINNGHEMPAWYDIFAFNQNAHEDEAGIKASQQIVETLITQEIAHGIKPERIVIAGFSQGGAIALHTALRHHQRLAGVLALSTYLPLKTNLEAEANPVNRNIPIFMAHGTHDEVISMATNSQSRHLLTQYYSKLEWHEYAMGHSVTNDEIADIRRFLCKILNISN